MALLSMLANQGNERASWTYGKEPVPQRKERGQILFNPKPKILRRAWQIKSSIFPGESRGQGET